MRRSQFPRGRVALLASGLLLLGACSQSPGRNDDAPDALAVSAPTLTESEAATLSSAGVGVVHHIVTARTLIAGGRVEEARNELVQARALLESLRKGSPAVRAESRNRHAREHLRTGEAQALTGKPAPTQADRDRVDAALAPTAVQLHLAAAMRSLESGEHSAAIDHLGAAEEAVQILVAAVAGREEAPAIN